MSDTLAEQVHEFIVGYLYEYFDQVSLEGCEQAALDLIAALKDVGYAVAELKSANLRGKWSIYAQNDMFIEDGAVVRVLPQSSGGTLSFLRPNAARAVAGALLAAADAAEASS